MEQEIGIISYLEMPKVENPKIAIRVQYAEKSFKGKNVISNLNMNVKEGTIYGLLGASGCGKTTILNCILGLNRLDSGSIEIFGYLTGSRESGIPGSRIGLMPQELSLFKEFTIKEILSFFGRIYGMNSDKIEERIEFLVKLLKLPENTQKFIKNLSGGQQRRVSFAVSLIHEAQILILDEPTVGTIIGFMATLTYPERGFDFSFVQGQFFVLHGLWERASYGCIYGTLRLGFVTNHGLIFIPWYAFTTPLQSDVWIASLILFLFVCLVQFISMYLHHQRKFKNVVIDSGTIIPYAMIMEQGVDPTLRKCIWEYLCELVETKKTTIIITTHYIEEAESASIVGILRNGRILVEESPQKLMADYGKGLNDIVLEISQNDEQEDWKTLGNPLEISRATTLFKRVPWNDKKSTKCSRIYALLMRNFIKMWRHISFIGLLLVFPSVGLISFALATNGKFDDIRFGLVNHEIENCTDLNTTGSNICEDKILSCQFLSNFPNGKFKFTEYSNEEIAITNLKRGKIDGYLSIPEDFTKILKFNRNSSSLLIQADNSNIVLYREIIKAIDSNFEHFQESWFKNCSKFGGKFNNTNTTTDNNYNMFEKLYGSENEIIINTSLPGMHLEFLLFMGMAMTGLTLILEKKSGIYERCLVAGVSTDEIIISHFLNQIGVSIIQSFTSLMTLIWVFQIPVLGSYFEIILLSIMIGCVGIWLGFLISALCPNETVVLQIIVVIISPILYSSGVFWPIEGMHIVMKYIAKLTPLNLPFESIKSITGRGWGITHQNVYPGFLVLVAYNMILPIIICLIYKFKH